MVVLIKCSCRLQQRIRVVPKVWMDNVVEMTWKLAENWWGNEVLEEEKSKLRGIQRDEVSDVERLIFW